MIMWNQTSFNVHVIMLAKVLADKILQEAFFKISLFVKYMREYIYIYILSDSCCTITMTCLIITDYYQ